MREKSREKSREKTRKIERKLNFYAKASDVKKALISKQPMIVLLKKETLVTNQVDASSTSCVVSTL